MILKYVEVEGFRGYRKPVRVDIADRFTVLEGRNGTGKSTLFDAVEFALTGTIAKYGDAKADRESILNYVWWHGEGPGPRSRYVEVGFEIGGEVVAIRRTPMSRPSSEEMQRLVSHLCDLSAAPAEPLAQLCTASILRDEHIAALSLDLNEAERYRLLRNAIGVTDADEWITRAARLVKAARQRVEAAEAEAIAAAEQLQREASRLDEVRKSLANEEAVAAAVSRLQAFSGSTLPPDRISEAVRAALAGALREKSELESLQVMLQEATDRRQLIPELQEEVRNVHKQLEGARNTLAALDAAAAEVIDDDKDVSMSTDWAALVALGRQIGRKEDRCPLCASELTEDAFRRGIQEVSSEIEALNALALRIAEHRRARDRAVGEVAVANQAVTSAEEKLRGALEVIEKIARLLQSVGLKPESTIEEVQSAINAVEERIGQVQEDLRTVEALEVGSGLGRAANAERDAKAAYARVQERLSRARRGKMRADALHDAARRASAETLDLRLERVLPLMSELYQRLRPHPTWKDIEYHVRGDVKRFLKLQVGNELNPQFMFSSGQRRATGLAFLLAVNLSLAWSKWSTILLDDPVQHIDDYRSVHLAEVLAQVSSTGRQIVCAVEDPALANLMCRRVPVLASGVAKRVSLGYDQDGALTVKDSVVLTPLPPAALVGKGSRAAG